MTHRGRRNRFVKMASNAAYYRRRAAQAGDTIEGQGFATKAAEIDGQLRENGRCEECGRPLTDETSLARRYGGDCWQKPSVQARVRDGAT